MMTLETEEMAARNSIDIIFIIFRRVRFDALFMFLLVVLVKNLGLSKMNIGLDRLPC